MLVRPTVYDSILSRKLGPIKLGKCQFEKVDLRMIKILTYHLLSYAGYGTD
jgi:hypothetical protein